MAETNEQDEIDHQWPTDPQQHLWGPWHSEKGLPRPTQYRICVHPLCHEVEHQVAPS